MDYPNFIGDMYGLDGEPLTWDQPSSHDTSGSSAPWLSAESSETSFAEHNEATIPVEASKAAEFDVRSTLLFSPLSDLTLAANEPIEQSSTSDEPVPYNDTLDISDPELQQEGNSEFSCSHGTLYPNSAFHSGHSHGFVPSYSDLPQPSQKPQPTVSVADGSTRRANKRPRLDEDDDNGPSSVHDALEFRNLKGQGTLSEVGPRAASLFFAWLSVSGGRSPDSRERKALRALTKLKTRQIVEWFEYHSTTTPTDPLMDIDTETPRPVRPNGSPNPENTCLAKPRSFLAWDLPRDPHIPYCCTNKCGKKFKRKGDWVKHELINCPQGTWGCFYPSCTAVFRRKDKLRDHIRNVHGAPRGRPLPIPKSACTGTYDEFSKRCGFCGLHCTVFQEWADHVAKHFEDKIEGGPWVMARWQQPWPEPEEDAADDSDDEDDDDEDTDDNSGGNKDNSDRDYPGGAPGASGNPFGDLPSRSYPGAGQGYHGQSGGHSGGSSGPTGGQTWTYRIASEDNPGNIMGSLALQESATVTKVVILLSIIVLGLANAQSSSSMDHFQRQLITKMGNGLPVTLVVVLFTYSSWENANFVTTELKRETAAKDKPRPLAAVFWWMFGIQYTILRCCLLVIGDPISAIAMRAPLSQGRRHPHRQPHAFWPRSGYESSRGPIAVSSLGNPRIQPFLHFFNSFEDRVCTGERNGPDWTAELRRFLDDMSKVLPGKLISEKADSIHGRSSIQHPGGSMSQRVIGKQASDSAGPQGTEQVTHGPYRLRPIDVAALTIYNMSALPYDIRIVRTYGGGHFMPLVHIWTLGVLTATAERIQFPFWLSFLAPAGLLVLFEFGGLRAHDKQSTPSSQRWITFGGSHTSLRLARSLFNKIAGLRGARKAQIIIDYVRFLAQTTDRKLWISGIDAISNAVNQSASNSKYYSARAPPRLRNELFTHPPIQIPVYKEDLSGVIAPIINSVKATILTYEMQGGSTNLFFKGNGTQSMSSRQDVSHRLKPNHPWDAARATSAAPTFFEPIVPSPMRSICYACGPTFKKKCYWSKHEKINRPQTTWKRAILSKRRPSQPFGLFISEAGLFEPRFFNMSPREAIETDPMQRLALTTAYKIIERFGFVSNRNTSTELDRIAEDSKMRRYLRLRRALMFPFDWVSRSSPEHALSHHDRRRLSIDDHHPDISLGLPQCLAPARPKFAPTASLQRSCSGLRLLSLDGGGVRGLLSVVILEQVMVQMGRELQLEHTAGTPKPCDLFDMICGTSTGGLIAVMLGRLRMIVGGSIDAYAELSKKIFGDPRSPRNFIMGSFKGSDLEKPRRLNSKRSLIITTRNRQLGEDLANGEPCIEILPFAPQEARDLLQSKAGRIADKWNDSDSKTLLEVLGRIPLAITQAAAFMRRNRMSLQKYLEALERDEQNLKDYLSTELQDHRRERGIPNSIFRTWKLSFDQIREQDPQAAAMLSLMAMLDRQQIPESLIRKPEERDVDFSTAIGTLNGLSLITTGFGEETFALHRLVQLSVHVWLEQHNHKAHYEEEALSLLADRFPSGEHENRETCESLFPYAQAVLRYNLVSEPSLIQRADLLFNISSFDWQQGRYDPAYEKISEVYDLRGKLLGLEDSQTLRSLDLLALVLQDQGKYEAAEEIHRRALEGRERVLRVEYSVTLASVNNLAAVLRDQGKYKAAKEILRRALKGWERVLGVEHPNTLTSVSNLAVALQDQGKYEAAEEIHRRALKGKERMLVVEHPDTLASVNNLAAVLQGQGKYKAAEEMLRRALKGSEKVLEVEHSDTLTNVSNLAMVLRGQEKYETAEEMHRRALEGKKRMLGVEHSDTLASVNNLATMFRGQGKYEAAEEMLRRALKRKKRVLGVEHPDILVSANNLAMAFRD